MLAISPQKTVVMVSKAAWQMWILFDSSGVIMLLKGLVGEQHFSVYKLKVPTDTQHFPETPTCLNTRQSERKSKWFNSLTFNNFQRTWKPSWPALTQGACCCWPVELLWHLLVELKLTITTGEQGMLSLCHWPTPTHFPMCAVYVGLWV